MRSRTIIVILTVISVAMTLVASVSFGLYLRNLDGDDSPVMSSSMRRQHVASKDYNNHFLAIYLKLDQNQIEMFRRINEYHVSSKQMLGNQIMDVNIQLSEAAGDDARMEELYSQLMKLHRDMNVQNYIYYTKIRSICDSVQVKRLDDFFRTTFCIDRSLCGMLDFKDGVPVMHME